MSQPDIDKNEPVLDNDIKMEVTEQTVQLNPEICGPLNLRFSGNSLTAAKYKDISINQDLIFYSGRDRLAVIMDGFGTNSNEFNQHALDLLRKGLNNLKGLDTNELIHKFGDRLIDISGKLNSETSNGGGASVVAIKFFKINGLTVGIFGQIGKARAYLLSEEGGYQLFTQDDATNTRYVAQSEVKNFLKTLDSTEDPNLIPQYSKLDMIWNENPLMPPVWFLGSSKLRGVHSGFMPVFKGSRVLLSTVGLYRNLTAGQITEILRNNPEPAKLLTEKALKASQDPNNKRANDTIDISAVVVEDIS